MTAPMCWCSLPNLAGIWDFESEISMKVSISMKIFGNFQTSLTQFLEGVRTNQRYHDDRTDVLVLSAKSDRNLRFRIWDVNEDFESEISMKILKCCFFSKEFQQKLKQNPIFKNTELFWRKIPFYRKSHFTWRNLVRFGKPIIPFYRDPILSGMYCRSGILRIWWIFRQELEKHYRSVNIKTPPSRFEIFNS